MVRSRQNTPYPSRPLLVALVLLLSLSSGCSSPMSLVEDAEEGGRSDRWEALGALAVLAADGRLQRLDADDRARMDTFLSTRFLIEPNPSLRARIVAIALDGELPCGVELLAQAFVDRGLAVRLEAVERVSSLPPLERRPALRRRLHDDEDALVRIAAARAYREIGQENWARELVEVIVDPRADGNVRFQAYLSAVELTGADLMFLREDWQSWLEEHGS